MELFAKLFASLLVFVYHCFDRIVIHGYLSGLSRPEQVVYFFRDVIGVPVVDKAVLRRVDCQADPQCHPDLLRTLRRALRLESTPLRSAQNEGAWFDRAGRQTLRLSADRQGNQSRPHLRAVPPAAMRPLANSQARQPA